MELLADAVLVVGDWTDPHAAAVGSAVQRLGIAVVMLDAASISRERWLWQGTSFSVFSNGRWATPARGWFRRLSPPGRHAGIEIGGREAAEVGARLTFVTSLNDSTIDWISDYWSIARGESKLVQYRAAADLGIPVPTTRVSSRVEDIGLGERFIVKPLGIGNFVVNGTSYAVHAKVVSLGDPVLDGLSVAPFLLQRYVEAASHLRIVTVEQSAFSAKLDAIGLPVDWRQEELAHTAWEPVSLPTTESMATRLAGSLELRFTSQDWILDHKGNAWFIDANPSGQWLFLPREISDPVTRRLSAWLAFGVWND